MVPNAGVHTSVASSHMRRRKILQRRFVTRMSSFSEQLVDAKSKLSQSLDGIYAQVENMLPADLQKNWDGYVKALKATGKDEIIHDLSNFNLTPATTTLLVSTFATLFLFSKLFKSSLKEAPKQQKSKKKKKPSKAQKANKDIQLILDYVEETYVPQIDEYLESYDKLDVNDREYKYKYFEEMLLKELMKLDGVDVAGNEVLRENRKKVIRFIQEHQKRLDKFKKDHS